MAKQTFTTGQVLTANNMTSLQQTAMGGGSATAKTASYTLVAADAGTTVIMNSASSTTITINTSLFAAGDTVFIVNQGAGVCTITAGTATVSTAGALTMSQNETGELYFLSASAAIFSKYTQASSASGALTFVGGTTFTTSAAVNVDNVFSATYANYLVVTDFVGSTTLGMALRFRVSGADNTTANYNSQSLYAASTTAGGSRSTAATSMSFTDASVDPNFAQITILNPFATAKTLVGGYGIFNGNTGIEVQNKMGTFVATTSFTGFSIFPSSGTITGSIRVYGLANS
jgi:hypothetical protein